MPRPLRILIAPDAFKECMSAREAAEAIERGARRAALAAQREIEPDVFPVSDGGAGFIDLFPFLQPPTIHEVFVTGPLGGPANARYAVGLARTMIHDEKGSKVRDARIAVIESSLAAGLALVPRDQRNPERTTTYGVGELIRHALGSGADVMLVGLGNSATCDGGAGAAAALGVKFRDEFGRTIEKPTGADLARIRDVDMSFADPRLADAVIGVLCDVNTPMLGRDGTAHVFAPQKGATPEQVERLAAGLKSFARVVKRTIGWRTHPKEELTGAAGGLAWGLTQEWCPLSGNDLTSKHFFDAELGFRADAAHLVLTGCGRVDRTDGHGKIVGTVALAASGAGVPCIVLVGAEGTPWRKSEGGCTTPPQVVITPPNTPLDEALRRAPEFLEAAAERVVRDWLARSPHG